MVKLIAKRAMRYGTRALVAGDVFDARPKDARVLTLLKRADVYVGNHVIGDEGYEAVVPAGESAEQAEADVTVVTDKKPKAVRRTKKG